MSDTVATTIIIGGIALVPVLVALLGRIERRHAERAPEFDPDVVLHDSFAHWPEGHSELAKQIRQADAFRQDFRPESA